MATNFISIHALREEGDLRRIPESLPPENISIHALREEGDPAGGAARAEAKRFLSTPSARRATVVAALAQLVSNHFYPRPPRGGRRQLPQRRAFWIAISIHALREEGDPDALDCHWRAWDFYPRPPRGGRPAPPRAIVFVQCNFYPRPPRGGRHCCCWNCYGAQRFLSTPSARRATAYPKHLFKILRYFYPRPPRGGRQLMDDVMSYARYISIHALREEGDSPRFLNSSASSTFLSTPSARRATRHTAQQRGHVLISIHALREEGDSSRCWQGRYTAHISIHALREEGDFRAISEMDFPCNFYPRPPRGGRLCFLICCDERVLNFYPRPLRGGRHHSASPPAVRPNFYPRPLRGGRQHCPANL